MQNDQDVSMFLKMNLQYEGSGLDLETTILAPKVNVTIAVFDSDDS
jgi:hypothetical protein